MCRRGILSRRKIALALTRLNAEGVLLSRLAAEGSVDGMGLLLAFSS